MDTPNVILIDDEEIILSGSMPVLEEALPDACISGFKKPSEALAFSRNNLVSIAYVDIEIGETCGFDICSKLIEINPEINVIFLTAYADYALEAWNYGACGFLVKPLCVSDVNRSLSTLRFPLRGVSD